MQATVCWKGFAPYSNGCFEKRRRGVVGEDELNVKIAPKCGHVTGPERLQTHAMAASSYIT